MILCLDIGNSQIFGGVFKENKLTISFRHDTTQSYTSDQLGIFLKNVLRENAIKPEDIKQIAISSVVPHLDYSITAACKKYFEIEPFILQAGVKTGIKIKYHNPAEVGADNIADSIAATTMFPNKNIIVIDFGTATTICPTTANKEFLGGTIIPGVRLAMESLQSNTAKLPTVQIIKPQSIVGKTTVESIQAGLYYGHLAAIRAITDKMITEVFADNKPIIIGTGGFASLFSQEEIFDTIVPNLVLDGLLEILKRNP